MPKNHIQRRSQRENLVEKKWNLQGTWDGEDTQAIAFKESLSNTTLPWKEEEKNQSASKLATTTSLIYLWRLADCVEEIRSISSMEFSFLMLIMILTPWQMSQLEMVPRMPQSSIRAYVGLLLLIKFLPFRGKKKYISFFRPAHMPSNIWYFASRL